MRSLSERLLGRQRRRWVVLSCFLLPCAVGITTRSKVAARANSDLHDVSDDFALALGLVGSPADEPPEGGGDRAERILSVNGVRFRVTVRRTEQAPNAVLDEVTERCVVSTFGKRWWTRWLPDPVLRAEGPDGGMVACLVPKSPWPDAKAVARALDALASTGRIDAVGDVDWVRVTSAGQGAVVTRLQSEGPVELLRIFRDEGDVRGLDPVPWARPPRSRRVLSATELGAEPALAGYESPLGALELLAWYRTEATRHKWDLVSTRDTGGGLTTLGFQRDGRMLLVSAQRSEIGSLVTVVRFR